MRLLRIIGLALLVLAAGGGRLDPDRSFSVLTMNCGNGDDPGVNIPAVVKILDDLGHPDIVLLQETKMQHEKIRALAGYSQVVASPDGPPLWSLPILLTDHPVLWTMSLPCGASQTRTRPAVCALLDVDGDRCLACSVHLDHIITPQRDAEQRVTIGYQLLAASIWTEMFEETPRSRCAEEILDRIAEFEADFLILGGDFNTVLPAKAIRRMRSRLHDALAFSPDYLTGTFNKLNWFISPRIDYIFHSPNLIRESAWVPDASPGDHRPVVAVFGH